MALWAATEGNEPSALDQDTLIFNTNSVAAKKFTFTLLPDQVNEQALRQTSILDSRNRQCGVLFGDLQQFLGDEGAILDQSLVLFSRMKPILSRRAESIRIPGGGSVDVFSGYYSGLASNRFDLNVCCVMLIGRGEGLPDCVQ